MSYISLLVIPLCQLALSFTAFCIVYAFISEAHSRLCFLVFLVLPPVHQCVVGIVGYSFYLAARYIVFTFGFAVILRILVLLLMQEDSIAYLRNNNNLSAIFKSFQHDSFTIRSKIISECWSMLVVVLSVLLLSRAPPNMSLSSPPALLVASLLITTSSVSPLHSSSPLFSLQ